MKQNKNLSIIIPTYNSETTIVNVIESCLKIKKFLNQIEILIIDDESDDDSVNLIKNTFSDYLQDTVFIYKRSHKGASSARNYGIEKSNGRYLMFVDSDDELKNVEIIAKVLKTINNNIDLVNFSGKKLQTNITKKHLILSNLGLLSTKKTFWQSGPVSKLYKRSFLINNKIKFPLDIIVGEDLIFNLICLEKVTGQIRLVPFSVYEIKENNSSITHLIIKKDFYQDNVKLSKMVHKYIKGGYWNLFILKRYFMMYIQFLKSNYNTNQIISYMNSFKREFNVKISINSVRYMISIIGKLKTVILISIVKYPRSMYLLNRLIRKLKYDKG
ncbi:MAG TPA: glycosyltransferase [Candidatus Dwaynia gallinarum]|nr:glycosyltransferase [Candidatus Dwaynia gallinarum]